jgi:transcriptional regulator with XRE-family HTH domain
MELAIKLGVSRQTISNWETNASRMDTDKLTQLCSILGVSYREILDYASKPDIINVENERLED